MSSPMRIVLMACGSFSPPTPMHLRMFEIARDYYMQMGTHNVIGGVISPVHDSYAKKGLIPSKHRLAMVKLALQSSNWIHLSDWECLQPNWTRTRDTLQYHQNYVNSYINDINGNLNEIIPSWIPKGIKQQNGNVQFKLLCGADLLESFAVPGLWAEEDIESILGQHGLVVISRSGSNPEKFIFDSDLLSKHKKNITIITNWVPNEVSSTVARRFLSRGLSVKYLLDDMIIEYIKQYNLYGIKDAKYILTSNNNNNNNNFNEMLLTSSIYEQQPQQKQQQQQIQQHTQNYISKNNTININNNNNNNNNNNKINTYLKKYNITNSYYNDMDVTDYSSHKSLVVNSLDENAKDVARPKVFCCDPLNVKSLINRPGQAVQILSNNTIIDTTNHHCIMKTTKHNRHYDNTNDVGDNNNYNNDNNDADNANDVLSNKDAIVYNADDNNNNNDDDDDDVDEVGENKLTTITLSVSTSIPSSSSSSFTTTPTTAITTCNNSNNGTISNNNSKINNCNKKLLRKFEYLSDSHLDKINVLESCLLNSLSEREMPSTSTRDQNDLIQFVFTAHGIRVISDKEYVV